jgi:tripartite-type tricarboxylate transporter receptor subunit TctC
LSAAENPDRSVLELMPRWYCRRFHCVPATGLSRPRHPKDIIAKLNAMTVQALADPAVQSRLSDLGFQVFPRAQQTPEGLRARQKADIGTWWLIIKELMIHTE